MAETKLLLNRSDTISIARTIFDKGAYMVPDCNYDEPLYTLIKTVDEFKSISKTTRLFFVLHDDWKSEPLEMKKFDHKELGEKYFIVQKSGGPTIDFLLQESI